MTSSLTIARAGLFSTLQDNGRTGLRHLGIPWSGCLVPAWQKLANTLVGNTADNCAIECWEGGLQLKVGDHPIRFAIVADAGSDISIESAARKSSLSTMRSYIAQAGDIISVNSTGEWRHAIIAIASLNVKPQLGSASTYSRANLGGLDGSALQQGNTIRIDHTLEGPEYECIDPLVSAYRQTDIRVVLGPQDDHFSADGLNNLLTGEYVLGSDADRMGVRLSGPPVSHRDDGAKNIVSDAIVPGSIQVPGNGQPIVLLSDAHTAGGYPKVATVISIDLPLLGLHRAGTRLTFREISIDEAIHAARHQHVLIQKAIAGKKIVREITFTTDSLLSNNLIDGVTDGSSF